MEIKLCMRRKSLSRALPYLERLAGAVQDVHVERRGPEGGVGAGVVGEPEELILKKNKQRSGD